MGNISIDEHIENKKTSIEIASFLKEDKFELFVVGPPFDFYSKKVNGHAYAITTDYRKGKFTFGNEFSCQFVIDSSSEFIELYKILEEITVFISSLKCKIQPFAKEYHLSYEKDFFLPLLYKGTFVKGRSSDFIEILFMFGVSEKKPFLLYNIIGNEKDEYIEFVEYLKINFPRINATNKIPSDFSPNCFIEDTDGLLRLVEKVNEQSMNKFRLDKSCWNHFISIKEISVI